MTRLPASRRLLPAVLGGTAAASVLVATPASGHPGHGAHGLSSGLLHPFTGVDHLLAMVAVGIVAAVGARTRTAWLAPAAFLGGMALGGAAGIAGMPLPGAETTIAASVILLGLVVAGAVRDDLALVAPGLVLAGIAHGHAHGAAAPAAAEPALYAGGFLLATVALHLAGAGVGVLVRNRHGLRAGLGTAAVTAGVLLLV